MKISYEIVATEVDKLYQKDFPDGAHKAIEEHCEFISVFIESCGWTVEEFVEEYVHRGLEEYLEKNPQLQN